MEGLIIMIVLAILGRIFSGGKKEEQQSKDAMPPFSNPKKPAQVEERREQPQKPRVETAKTYTSLEDFTREMFGELSGKKEQETAAPKTLERNVQEEVTSAPSVFEAVTQPTVPESTIAQPSASRVSTRPELGASRPIVQREKRKGNDYVNVPTTKQQLVQAIIASEIIGQPKARQNRR